MPITHIVLFEFRHGLSPEAINDISKGLLSLRQDCIHPTTKQPYILSASGGIDNSPEGMQHDITHAFVVQFATAEDRDYYVREDPAHRKFIRDLIDGNVRKVQVVDFEDGVL